MDKFKNKTAIVTGGGSGIGKAIASELVKRGATVVITDINEERITEVVSELKQKNEQCSGFKVDHTSLEQVKNFHQEFLSQYKSVDIMCLNAGIGLGDRIEDMNMEKWEKVMGINFWGVVYMVQLFIAGMIQKKNGSILITSSIAGLVGLPGMSAYCASKFAVLGFAESLRAELKSHNIGVTALCPGVINTNIIKDGDINTGSENVSKSMVDEFYQKVGAEPEQVASDAIRALEKDVGIMATPWNTYFPWTIKRISEDIYTSLINLVW
ncbi:MAG: SDR family oxidoreductase, partial [Spirochaetota bacterium]